MVKTSCGTSPEISSTRTRVNLFQIRYLALRIIRDRYKSGPSLETWFTFGERNVRRREKGPERQSMVQNSSHVYAINTSALEERITISSWLVEARYGTDVCDVCAVLCLIDNGIKYFQ